jgi:arginase
MMATRAIEPIGVPSSAGSLYTGTESAPAAYRAAGLLDALRDHAGSVHDGGDLPIPPTLPRHDIPPIRNWPAPRIVWEIAAERVAATRSVGRLPFLFGGDCSIVVGTTDGLVGAGAAPLHAICLDAHIDAAEPRADKVVGAAALGLRIATTASPFWQRPALEPAAVTSLGCHERSSDLPFQLAHVDDVRRAPAATARNILAEIPADASILVHFDVDVLDAAEMPAAYSPTADGLSSDAVAALLGVLLADERLEAIELTELTVQRDLGGESSRLVVDIVDRALAAVQDPELHGA